MSKLIKVLFLISILTLGVSCQKEDASKSTTSKDGHSQSKSKVYYTCSMHPQIKEDKPGKCPICHMNLTKIEIDDDEDDQVTTVVPEKDIWTI